ncbi:MAG: FadR/GntR family transcriptional regulator, partial [Actinocrinis sp.]
MATKVGGAVTATGRADGGGSGSAGSGSSAGIAADEDGRAYSPFRAVRAGNAFEQTVERILHAVKLGAVPPGQKLPPERELSALLGVSRDTLREAIRALAAEGIVESRRGRGGGTYVLRVPGPPPDAPLSAVVDELPHGLDA